MKKTHIIKYIVFIALVAVASPTFASVTEPVASGPVTETPEAKVARLQQRIEEIKAMDKSQLSRAERRALKKEVREIKDEVKAVGGGVYISLGALLVVIILLLILL